VEKRKVAIKKVKRVFEDLIDCKRILREIAILTRVDDGRIVKLYDICVPSDLSNFTEIYLVLELCDSDFKKLFQLNEFLTESHTTTLLYNTLCGIKYLHTAGIYHRDLKPANCLVNTAR
jgi:mitogen-activated protein kinase 1/3